MSSEQQTARIVGIFTKVERLKSWFFKIVEEDVGDDIPRDDIAASVVIIAICLPLMLYFYLHQAMSTGFFTIKFDILEAVFLYGILLYWIVTSALILIGQKHASRDLDSFGGLAFATVGSVWLIFIFPFDFINFAEASPDILRILLQWISNEIALIILILAFIAHLVFAVFAGFQRVYVRKAMSRLKKEAISADLNT
ncbi:MAG: hypothetical protein ACFFFG_08775 [Candidatus Thorarchaeota archaeon]